VLVTILGDSVVPAGGSVWMSDLVALAEPFGFSSRLVRTSMSRLLSEGWVTNERIGRQSTYSITAHGMAETSVANRRIYTDYADAAAEWDGRWHLVLVDAGPSSNPDLHRQLGWRGFHLIRTGVYAAPALDTDVSTGAALAGLGLDEHTLLATAIFDQAQAVITADSFRASSGLAECETGYRGFVDFHRDLTTSQEPTALTGAGAFAWRTMIVHDLRRLRLRDPQLPHDLLPPDWIGQTAFDLARQLYRSLDSAAWQWIADTTELRPDLESPALNERFAHPRPLATQGAS
jgi:phenylacetic acid degradation operon negative regulatory protein